MIAVGARFRALLERIGIAALIGAILAAVAARQPVDNVLQGWVSDATVAARVELFGARPLDSRHVVVVGMDARTMSAPELISRPQAMFSPVYAELAQKAFAHGAKGLIVDVILAYDAKDLVLGDDAPLRRYDNDLLRVLKSERERGRLVLGRSAGVLPARRFTLIAGERGIGMVEVPLGPGGVVREVPTLLPDTSGDVHPTLSGRALGLLGQAAPPVVNILPPAAISTLPAVSMIDILRCDDPGKLRAVVEGRVLFLGGALPGQDRLKVPDLMIDREIVAHDAIDPADTSVACSFPRPPVRAPDEPSVPGVFIHAAATDAVASGWQVHAVGEAARIATVFASAFLCAFLAFVLRPVAGAVAMTVVVAGVFFAAVAALEFGAFLPVSWAMTAGPVGFLVGYGLRIRLLDRKSNMVRREFGRYLSPVLVQQMLDTGQLPDLAGEERDVTVLFADLSGFTAASEKVESAELMRILNRYLDTMAGVIAEHGGYVDKFIGDAVMAIFNAPVALDDHVGHAVAAAREIARRIEEMSESDRSRGDVAFGIKIGIATGSATVGNVGARERINYTVVGETVNLAARFEGLPALFGTPIVIGPLTAEAVRDRYSLLRIVSVQVKGKTEGVSVHAPFDADSGSETAAAIDAYEAALAAFEAGNFDCAADAWSALAGQDWPGASIAGAMAGQARALAAAPPADWRGVLVAEGK